MPGFTKTEWTGDVSGSWTTAGNWSNGVPVAVQSEVYFNQGSVSCTDDLPVKDDEVHLHFLFIGPKFTGNIGTSTVPLELGTVTEFQYGQKVGQTFLYSATIHATVISSTSTENPALSFVENVDDGAGSTQTLLFASVDIVGGLGTILFDQVWCPAPINMVDCQSVTLEISANCLVDSCALTVAAGRVVSYAQDGSSGFFGNVVISGGMVEFVQASGDSVSNAVQSITIYDGICKWKPTAASEVAVLNVYGGIFDARGCVAANTELSNVKVYGKGVIDERNGLGNIVYKNDVTFYEGIVLTDSNRTLTVVQ